MRKMEAQRKPERVNQQSTLLTPQENEFVFSLLGPQCLTVSTAVVQLFVAEATPHSSPWRRQSSGIACYVRDSTKRAYFIRVYCTIQHALIWEEKMYRSIEIMQSRKYLITFQGQKCMVALNFANENEASHFYESVVTTTRSKKERPNNPILPSPGDNYEDSNGFRQNYRSNLELQNQVLQPPKLPSPNKINAIDSKDKTKTKNKKNKITKGDISNPLNFEHLGHSDSYDDYLRGIGISDQHLNNTKTRELLYGIIEDHHKNQSIHDDPDTVRKSHKHEVPKMRQQNRNNLHPPMVTASPSMPNLKHSSYSDSPPPLPPTNTLPKRSTEYNLQQFRSNQLVGVRSPPPTVAPPPPPTSTLPPPTNTLPSRIEDTNKTNYSRKIDTNSLHGQPNYGYHPSRMGLNRNPPLLSIIPPPQAPALAPPSMMPPQPPAFAPPQIETGPPHMPAPQLPPTFRLPAIGAAPVKLIPSELPAINKPPSFKSKPPQICQPSINPSSVMSAAPPISSVRAAPAAPSIRATPPAPVFPPASALQPPLPPPQLASPPQNAAIQCDLRSALLGSIRNKPALKPVLDNRSKDANNSNQSNASGTLEDVLRKVLAEREKQIQHSDDGEDSDSDGEDSDEWTNY